MAERLISSGRVRICAEDFGDPRDPTVLLINGATSSMLRWEDDFCRRLAGHGRHVVRFDNRDTGRSITYPPGTAPYTLEDLADDATVVLDAFGVERAHVVGTSMGGMIAQQLALRHPARVLSITPIMSTPDPTVINDGRAAIQAALPGPSADVIALMSDIADIDWSDPVEAIDAMVEIRRILTGSRYVFDEPRERALAAREIERADRFASRQNHSLAVAQTPRWRERLVEIRVPAVVIHGSEDPILPYEHGVALAKEIAGATLLTMERVGHELPPGEWDLVISALVSHAPIG